MAALSHGDRKAMAELKYPASFNQKVDVGKVKTDVIAKHIEDTLSSLLPPDDDITVQAFINEINAAEGTSLDPRRLQLFLTEYIGKQEAATYMENLWKLLLSAQSSKSGIAHEIIEAKVADLRSIESTRVISRVDDGDRYRQPREGDRDQRSERNPRRGRDERDERRSKRSNNDRSISPRVRGLHQPREKGSSYRDDSRRSDARDRSRTPVDRESREPTRHRHRHKSPRGRGSARDERPAKPRRRSASPGSRTPTGREDRHRENGHRYRDESRSRSRSSRRQRRDSRSRRNVARDFRDDRRNRRTWDSYRPSERPERKRRNSSSDEDESKGKRNRGRTSDVDDIKAKRSRDPSQDSEEAKSKRVRPETADGDTSKKLSGMRDSPDPSATRYDGKTRRNPKTKRASLTPEPSDSVESPRTKNNVMMDEE